MKHALIQIWAVPALERCHVVGVERDLPQTYSKNTPYTSLPKPQYSLDEIKRKASYLEMNSKRKSKR